MSRKRSRLNEEEMSSKLAELARGEGQNGSSDTSSSQVPTLALQVCDLS